MRSTVRPGLAPKSELPLSEAGRSRRPRRSGGQVPPGDAQQRGHAQYGPPDASREDCEVLEVDGRTGHVNDGQQLDPNALGPDVRLRPGDRAAIANREGAPGDPSTGPRIPGPSPYQ